MRGAVRSRLNKSVHGGHVRSATEPEFCSQARSWRLCAWRQKFDNPRLGREHFPSQDGQCRSGTARSMTVMAGLDSRLMPICLRVGAIFRELRQLSLKAGRASTSRLRMLSGSCPSSRATCPRQSPRRSRARRRWSNRTSGASARHYRAARLDRRRPGARPRTHRSAAPAIARRRRQSTNAI